MYKEVVILFFKRIIFQVFLLMVLMSDAMAQETSKSETTREDFIRLDIAYIIGVRYIMIISCIIRASTCMAHMGSI